MPAQSLIADNSSQTVHWASTYADGPIRVSVRDASLSAIDWSSPVLKSRDLELLERLQGELEVRLQMGLEREASGIAAAMLIVWHTATHVDIAIESGDGVLASMHGR